jgi:hypothetical protein
MVPIQDYRKAKRREVASPEAIANNLAKCILRAPPPHDTTREGDDLLLVRVLCRRGEDITKGLLEFSTSPPTYFGILP